MASIIERPNGTREIRFVVGDERPVVRLGQCPSKTADEIKYHVERLAYARATNATPPTITASWLAGIADELHDRLARVGLVESRASRADVGRSVVAYVDAYIERRQDVGESTKLKWRQARDRLVRHTDATRPIGRFTPGDAADFKGALIAAKLSPSTWGKLVKIARMFFADAASRGLIERNPFAKVKGHGQANRERIRYVDAATIGRVLDATANADLRLIVLLARWAGLRCPSEPHALRWADVDWQGRRLFVRSAKTAGHGKGARSVPIAPALYPTLLDAFERSEPGQVYVVSEPTRQRGAGQNLRTALLRACDRSGVAAWPRLFHNLRASCITDWCERLPAHAASEFAGNTAAIAAAHYLAPTPAHYAAVSDPPPANAHQNAHHEGHAHHKAHQRAAATSRTIENKNRVREAGNESVRLDVTPCETTGWPPWDLNPHSLARNGF